MPSFFAQVFCARTPGGAENAAKIHRRLRTGRHRLAAANAAGVYTLDSGDGEADKAGDVEAGQFFARG